MSDSRRALIDAQEKRSLRLLEGSPPAAEPLDSLRRDLAHAERTLARAQGAFRPPGWIQRLIGTGDRGEPGTGRPDPSAAAGTGRGPKVALISHSGADSNSTYHVLSLTRELTRLGCSCVVVVPEGPTDHPEHGVVTYDEALLPGGAIEGVDLLHAWTPREHVRRQTLALSERLGRPYLVHMEDNEEQLMGDTLRWRGVVDPDALDDDALEAHLTVRRSHPRRFRGFIAGAAGYSCLIDPLLEFAPPDAPQAVFWPGYDFEPGPDTDPRTERDGLGIAADELIVFYPGNTHRSNVGDVVDLYTACILARRQGARIRLVRTGVSHAPIRLDPDLDPAGVVVELGFVDRARLAPLMSAADILVQPGRPGPFNDYRFPSKLPEFLAAGRPVVLPATNLGRHLQNGVEALVLDTGSVEEMVEAIMRLAGDADLRRRLGGAGRRFAQARLSWANAGGMLNELYRTVLATSATPSG